VHIVDKKPVDTTTTVVSPSGTIYKSRTEAEAGMEDRKGLHLQLTASARGADDAVSILWVVPAVLVAGGYLPDRPPALITRTRRPAGTCRRVDLFSVRLLTCNWNFSDGLRAR
jgi:hypothetical protein